MKIDLIIFIPEIKALPQRRNRLGASESRRRRWRRGMLLRTLYHTIFAMSFMQLRGLRIELSLVNPDRVRPPVRG